jgi:hypothetical protein
MVERQGEGPIVDRSLEHLSATDAPLIKMRAILLEACRNLQQGNEPYNANHPKAYSTVSIECLSEHTDLDRHWRTSLRSFGPPPDPGSSRNR